MAADRDSAPDASAVADGSDDLRDSLLALSGLATGQLPLTDVLTRVAELAVNAIPGAEGAGLTLKQKDRSDTIVATAAFVNEVDAIQYGLGEGPCISAAAEGRTVQSHSLGEDDRWRLFGAQVAEKHVHSALSLPLITTEGVVGAMNVYAHPKDAFSPQSVQMGELFAIPAAIAVQNAQVLADAQRLTAHLQNALANRSVIDQAIGIMMSRSGTTADDAFSRLRELSQTQHQKLHAVAQAVVDQAVRRARARQANPG